MADDFEGIPSSYFDAVVLNSVVQYFPDFDYLIRVLRGALRAVRPGGFVFVGDVRNLDLMEAFHASILLETAPESMSGSEMKSEIAGSVGREEELLVSPRFFASLRSLIPEAGSAEINLKRSSHYNELTKYRYNVVLEAAGNQQTSVYKPGKYDWQRDSMTAEGLPALLASNAHECLVIQDIPNSRVIREIEALRLAKSGIATTIAELKMRAVEAASAALDPEDICRIGEDLSYQVRLNVSQSFDSAFFDVVFLEAGRDWKGLAAAGPPIRLVAEGEIRSYVNSPLQDKIAARLVPELRDFLANRLPDYMVPTAFVILESLPTNANGKIDRKNLPNPSINRRDSAFSYVPPVTQEEQLIAGIWSQVLGVSSVGIKDNFFDIGGHSLRATQVVSAIRNIFRVEIPLVDFFTEPTIAALASKVNAATRVGSGTNLPNIRPAAHPDDAPLSLAQQRLWFIDQLTPGSPVYNVPIAFRMTGKVSIPALTQAMSEVVRRHETLRTSFQDRDGPRQLIHPYTQMGERIADLSGLPISDLEGEARGGASIEGERIFQLDRGPLTRFSLLRLGAEEISVLITMHHIITDGWSVTILINELCAVLNAFVAGVGSPLQELELQYADFCYWQREWVDRGLIDKQAEFWMEKIGECPAVVELPSDKPRPPMQTFNGAAVRIAIPRNVTSRVKEFARANGATDFMVMLSAFQALLHRYTGEESIIVGTPIAGRNRSELERLIGFFVNTLILRAEIGGRTAFRDLVNQVRDFALAAYSNQDIPFERLVEELRPSRDLSRSPLFQIMFALQSLPGASPEVPAGYELSAQPSESNACRFDLEVQFLESDRDFIGTVTYATDLYEEATILRLADHYLTLLNRSARNPELRIEDLALMNEAEEIQVARFSIGERQALSGLLVHELIERSVRQTPDAIAAIKGQEFSTYFCLNHAAERLAQRLRRLGVGAESRVGVFVTRGVGVLAGLLGVLKAGAAYVPLDPAYPDERISLIIRDAGIALVIAERGSRNQALGVETEILLLEEIIDGDPLDGKDLSTTLISSPGGSVLSPDQRNLAYVIYTSGSTGVPKGVAIEHRSAAAFLDWAGSVFDANELSRVLASTSICFDLSVFELFATLSRGGTVIVAENAFEIAELSRKHNATLINTVPSAMHEILREGNLPDSIVTVNIAGEALSMDMVDAIYRKSRASNVYNLYGPTEDTTYSTFALIEPAGSEKPRVGNPISNSQAYVLLSGFHRAAVGISGSIFLGGQGLARGYLSKPDLTADAFLPAPFRDCCGDRIYRTGDIGRWCDDGNLDFLGRTDHQVKIRGFRIELGEIEAALKRCKGVTESVAVPVQGSDRTSVLVAYVVCDNPDVSVDGLRGALAASLPGYLVPAAVVALQKMPLTPNGKVDRKALEQSSSWRTEANDYASPNTPVQKLIAGIWEDVLGVKPIGVNHNFFELGGHSLLAVRVLNRLREAAGPTIPLAAIFEAPTVEGLAKVIENERSFIDYSTKLVEIQGGNHRPKISLVPGIGGTIGDFRHLAPAIGADQPVSCFSLSGSDASRLSIEEIAGAHV
ncbi:MAG TPA: amino acid adenylation domain-containing protein, partial [Blastocatellia bacterium]|nr:amino acid adenylation domain-containing protein [Blastocatellia bacterium]